MTIDELQLLLTLNGNKRLPHLEEEIFANYTKHASTLAHVYLHNLCKDCKWYSIAHDDDTLVLHYALLELGSRWVEAECVIYEWKFWTNAYNSRLNATMTTNT